MFRRVPGSISGVNGADTFCEVLRGSPSRRRSAGERGGRDASRGEDARGTTEAVDGRDGVVEKKRPKWRGRRRLHHGWRRSNCRPARSTSIAKATPCRAAFIARQVSSVTPIVLDGMYAEMRAGEPDSLCAAS